MYTFDILRIVLEYVCIWTSFSLKGIKSVQYHNLTY